MSAKLLLGKPVAEKICGDIVERLNGANPKLCLLGFEEPRWNQYANSLKKSAEKYGFICENVVLKNGISVDEFSLRTEEICARRDVCGVMVQQPLDEQYKSVVEHISVDKDVDCLNPMTVYKLYNGEQGLRPATPQAVIRLLDFYQIDLQGKNVVVVGRGKAVGKPLALMLLERNATVTICHTKTVDLPSVCRNADIIVSACGVAGLITSEYVSESSIVIDVGLSFVDGKTCGDVSGEAYEKCCAVSPVPGGIGPITRATLFENLFKAAKVQNDDIR